MYTLIFHVNLHATIASYPDYVLHFIWFLIKIMVWLVYYKVPIKTVQWNLLIKAFECFIPLVLHASQNFLI